MADHFWLQETDLGTIVLENTVQELTLGGNTRAFTVNEFLGAAGGFVRGFGNTSQKTFIVKRKEKKETGDETAWNSRRTDLMKWFSLPRWKTLEFYIRDGEDTFTVKTRVFATDIPEDTYSFFHITDMRSFMLVSPKGVFEKTTTETGTAPVTGSSEETVNIDNDGIWDVPIILKFTPTGNETLFQVQIADNFGIRLEGSFNAGEQVVYNTTDNSLTIDGVTQDQTQFITGGSVFNIAPGNQDLFVLASGSGTFNYEFTERYS